MNTHTAGPWTMHSAATTFGRLAPYGRHSPQPRQHTPPKAHASPRSWPPRPRYLPALIFWLSLKPAKSRTVLWWPAMDAPKREARAAISRATGPTP
jgi:hypothetical protein